MNTNMNTNKNQHKSEQKQPNSNYNSYEQHGYLAENKQNLSIREEQIKNNLNLVGNSDDYGCAHADARRIIRNYNMNVGNKYQNYKEYFYLEIVNQILDCTNVQAQNCEASSISSSYLSKTDSILTPHRPPNKKTNPKPKPKHKNPHLPSSSSSPQNPKLPPHLKIKTNDIKFNDEYEYNKKYYTKYQSMIQLACLVQYYKYYLQIPMPMVNLIDFFKLMFVYQENIKEVYYKKYRGILGIQESCGSGICNEKKQKDKEKQEFILSDNIENKELKNKYKLNFNSNLLAQLSLLPSPPHTQQKINQQPSLPSPSPQNQSQPYISTQILPKQRQTPNESYLFLKLYERLANKYGYENNWRSIKQLDKIYTFGLVCYEKRNRSLEFQRVLELENFNRLSININQSNNLKEISNEIGTRSKIIQSHHNITSQTNLAIITHTNTNKSSTSTTNLKKFAKKNKLLQSRLLTSTNTNHHQQNKQNNNTKVNKAKTNTGTNFNTVNSNMNSIHYNKVKYRQINQYRGSLEQNSRKSEIKKEQQKQKQNDKDKDKINKPSDPKKQKKIITLNDQIPTVKNDKYTQINYQKLYSPTPHFSYTNNPYINNNKNFVNLNLNINIKNRKIKRKINSCEHLTTNLHLQKINQRNCGNFQYNNNKNGKNQKNKQSGTKLANIYENDTHANNESPKNNQKTPLKQKNTVHCQAVNPRTISNSKNLKIMISNFKNRIRQQVKQIDRNDGKMVRERMEFYSRHQENVNGNGNVQHRNRASGEGFNIKVNNCMKKKKEQLC